MHAIVQAIAEYAQTQPDKIAVIADEVKISYHQLWNEIQGYAAYIRKLGFPKGSRIVVKSAPSIWFAVSCFAIQLSGNIHVPVEKTIGEDGLRDVASQLEAAMVVADFPAFNEVTYLSSGEVRNVAIENYRDGLQFCFPTPDETCDILFTTGTTGKSKGVMLSHRAVVAVAENVAIGDDIREGNVYLVPTPINHAGSIRKLYASMLTGTTAVLLDGFMNVKKLYQYMDDYQVTSIVLPPAAARVLLTVSAKQLAKYDGQLRFIHTGAAAFPESDKERLCQLLPNVRLYFAYGSSEAGCVSMFNYAEHKGLISCVGKPNKNADIFIVDQNRCEIQSSKENQGTIAIRGDVTMQGYWNEPELTAGVLIDGAIYTNDVGYIDENGFIYMLGRIGDVINVGGLKVAPTEVEDIVLRFPGIAECACFAVADTITGSAPKLIYVVEEGKSVDPKELRAHMTMHLEGFKIPKTLQQVDAVPKTNNGKIDRKVLK